MAFGLGFGLCFGRGISAAAPSGGVAPSFTSGPTASGTPQEGDVLTLTYAAAGDAPITVTRRWLLNSVAVPGATSAIWIVDGTTAGDTITPQMRLENAAGDTGWVSAPDLTVQAITNTLAPTLDTSGFGGSWYVIDPGEWTGSPILYADLQVSDDGSTGWTDFTTAWAGATAYEQGARVSSGGVTYTAKRAHTSAAAFATDLAAGIWTATLAAEGFDLEGQLPVLTLDGKYIRARVWPAADPSAIVTTGATLLRDSPTHVLFFSSTSQTRHFDRNGLTSPLFGADLDAGGIWFSGMVYWPGSGNISGYTFSLGNLGSSQIGFHPGGMVLTISNLSTFTSVDQPFPSLTAADVGWYLLTARVWRDTAGEIKISLKRNVVEATATRSEATNVSDWNLTTLRIGSRALSTSTQFSQNRVCCLSAGTGDPTAFHEWVYNNGKFRYPLDYTNVTDNNMTFEFFEKGWRTGTATWSSAQMADEIGALDTIGTVANGGPAWNRSSEVLPGFVKPSGPAPDIPQAIVSPQHVFAGTPQSLQFAGGQGKIVPTPLAASAWVTGTAYVADDRVTNGGLTYICISDHTASASFATDAARWVSYEVTGLTHAGFASGSLYCPDGSSSLGDISGTVTDGVFTCLTPGTITASVNVGGVARTATAYVYPAVTMPATPRNAADFGGNGLVAALEPYPTIGAGTSYANAAALSAAIQGMTSGATLIVEDLTDLSNDVTLTARDFGGAVVVARNLHGVAVRNILMNGVRNLTIRGFSADVSIGDHVGTTSAANGVGGVWLDHCEAKAIRLSAYNISSILRVTNFTTTDTDILSTRVYNFAGVVINRAAWGETITGLAEDTIRLNNCDRYVVSNVWVGDNKLAVDDAHPDLVQSYGNGPSGTRQGVFQNMVMIDQSGEDYLDVDTGLTRQMLPQGLFLSDGFWDGLLVNQVAVAAGLKRQVSISASRWNNVVQNCFGDGSISVNNGFPRSALAVNNVHTVSDAVLPSTNWGTETGTRALASEGIAVTEVYPDYNTYPTSWRRWANPASGFESVGPATFIAELEAKRVELGL